MNDFLYYLGWEIINISLEYTAASWAANRLRRLFPAVVVVNLATHPLFTWALGTWGRDASFVALCEIGIFLVEWTILVAIYGRSRWRLLLLLAFVMNAASLGTGLLLSAGE